MHVLEAEEERGEDGLTSRANVLEVSYVYDQFVMLHIPYQYPLFYGSR